MLEIIYTFQNENPLKFNERKFRENYKKQDVKVKSNTLPEAKVDNKSEEIISRKKQKSVSSNIITLLTI